MPGVFGLALMWAGAVGNAQQPDSVRLSGTYSSLCYHQEAGDLLGVEVQILPLNGGGWTAVVQIAEGGLPEIFLTVAKQEGDQLLSFSVPYLGGAPVKIRGTVSTNGMQADFAYPSGSRTAEYLKRGVGYWEKQVTCGAGQ